MGSPSPPPRDETSGPNSFVVGDSLRTPERVGRGDLARRASDRWSLGLARVHREVSVISPASGRQHTRVLVSAAQEVPAPAPYRAAAARRHAKRSLNAPPHRPQREPLVLPEVSPPGQRSGGAVPGGGADLPRVPAKSSQEKGNAAWPVRGVARRGEAPVRRRRSDAGRADRARAALAGEEDRGAARGAGVRPEEAGTRGGMRLNNRYVTDPTMRRGAFTACSTSVAAGAMTSERVDREGPRGGT